MNDISSCIGLTINNDPAHVPEHEILIISTICSDTFRFTIICVRFTCSRLESILHHLDYSVPLLSVCSIRQRTGYRDLAHSFQIIQTTRFRSLTDRFHPRLGNSLPRTETASLLVCVDDHVRLILVKLVVQLSLLFWLEALCSVLLHVSRFHMLRCKTLPAVGIALLCSRVLGSRSLAVLFTGSRVPSLAVSLSSRPFGTCFHQPSIHPLGLKASVVHGRFIRRRSGHVAKSNLLKTLDVKGLQYVTMCILPSSINCTFVTRLAKHSVSTACQAAGSSPTFSPAQVRHSHLNIHVRGRPHALEFAVYSLSLASSEFII